MCWEALGAWELDGPSAHRPADDSALLMAGGVAGGGLYSCPQDGAFAQRAFQVKIGK